MAKVSRRKFLTIAASSLSLLLPFDKLYASSTKKVSWKGIALGAQSNMTLFHENKEYAKKYIVIYRCVPRIKTPIRRLILSKVRRRNPFFNNGFSAFSNSMLV